MTVTPTLRLPRTALRCALLSTVCLGGVLALAACDNVGGGLTDILHQAQQVAEGGSSTTTTTTTRAVQPAAAPAAATGPSVPAAAGLPAYQDTGTVVGQKVRTIRADMARLSDSINQRNGDLQRIRNTLAGDANTYFAMTARINSRLQIGAAPADPELTQQFNTAQTQLARMNADISAFNALTSQLASDRAFATYVNEEIKAAFALQGAVEQDHRQLTALQAAANRDAGLIDQLNRAIADDIARQNNYLANERRNLANLSLAIKNGELYNNNGQAAQAAPPSANTGVDTVPSVFGDRRPLVTIRFDRPDVPYEQALYTAISRALERRPDAMFDLVAVSPNSGNAAQVTVRADQAKRNAQSVMRTLARMGLPAERLALSATTSTSVHDSEVQIFVR